MHSLIQKVRRGAEPGPSMPGGAAEIEPSGEKSPPSWTLPANPGKAVAGANTWLPQSLRSRAHLHLANTPE